MYLLYKETSKGLIKLSFKQEFDAIINLVIFRQLIPPKLFFPQPWARKPALPFS